LTLRADDMGSKIALGAIFNFTEIISSLGLFYYLLKQQIKDYFHIKNIDKFYFLMWRKKFQIIYICKTIFHKYYVKQFPKQFFS